MIYLADKANKLISTNPEKRAKVFGMAHVSNGWNWSNDGTGKCIF